MTSTFTKAAGIGFIVLSALRLTPIINATGKWLLYVSIAALFLILSDLLEFIIEGIVEKKGVNLNKARKLLRSIFLASAVIVIIVLPNLKIDIPVKQVNALSDAVTLVSLGIAITLIGFKTERVQISSFNNTNTINNEVREFINSIEGKKIIDERISELSLQNAKQL